MSKHRISIRVFLVICLVVGSVGIPGVHRWQERVRLREQARKLRAAGDVLAQRVLVAKENAARAEATVEFTERLGCWGLTQLDSERATAKKAQQRLASLQTQLGHLKVAIAQLQQ